jgi:hypothetical protein
MAGHGGGGFRAACLVRPGDVAGVTAGSMRWFRATRTSLMLRATNRAELAGAIACFPSPQSGEVLVLCAGGDVARVPVRA